MATVGVTTTVNIGNLPFSTTLSGFMRSQSGLLSRLIDLILENRTNDSNPMLASICNGVIMVAEYSGMTTALSARAFFRTSQSAALTIPELFEDGKALVAAWDDLKLRHGNRFPYARALNLAGIDRLDIRHFANLAYCAWFSRNNDPTYKYMVAPKATMDTKTLQLHTVTPMGAMVGVALTEEHAAWFLTKAVTQATLEEISKKSASCNADVCSTLSNYNSSSQPTSTTLEMYYISILVFVPEQTCVIDLMNYLFYTQLKFSSYSRSRGKWSLFRQFVTAENLLRKKHWKSRN
jgi:hypothetical protein